ncbi:hydroxyethylthiazole kinase [Clostridium botulinum]|uniref:Hydroxyethylthiazole kinase n=1 Tax=Clostridium botulinum C/D str. DC5 TaxID=1443128 RepID=A0A0A0IB74_CLOBO|nr:hydroxyethylthiazole kinase [Clostridium botulinum]KEI01169.1 hydroxyethylthiazole kinase [Clostridium botulinum C/D str. BKT75002]KEI13352.1 hydroxyethylthiazole kinase [Clostridium botulinum C/D str. BKT2873]KGM98485.1 hydroxyethylthiazole kinase [Clostridium botulinum D str. CCUG 7971]KGM98704.1 hydroxyethylthiazole kinase [Clostridium botulinum C/D str. DC5]KOC47165.1 hydroxyethylthiazole kinase [Clostridium botulinum]
MLNNICNTFLKVKKQTPLVQAITNYVTINDCANMLLAYGASPAMVEAYDESYDFAKLASCIYINLGTLTREQEEAMIMASISAKNNNIPVVLDPVACGAISRKCNLINKLLELGKIDIIKGNIGEIKFLAGYESKTRGVDSVDNGYNSIEACTFLAKKFNCTVAATGVKDIITDGTRTAMIENGSNLLTLVTGAGCMVGALTAATAGVEEDKFIATITSILSMNLAAEHAEKKSNGPGSFKVNLIDKIYSLKETDLKEEGKIKWI